MTKEGRKEGNALFNDALSTFYLQLCCVEHVVKDDSDNQRENRLLPLHGLLILISSKDLFYMHHPTDRIAFVMEWLSYARRISF